MYKVMITGHRPKKLPGGYNLNSVANLELRSRIEVELDRILETHPDLIMITGMALGVDTIFAKLAIAKGIPFVACVPCRDQDKMWIPEAKVEYKDLLSKAIKTILVTDAPYSAKVMDVRNQFMVRNSDEVIAVWDNSPSGTANAVYYARNQKKKITIIPIFNDKQERFFNKD